MDRNSSNMPKFAYSYCIMHREFHKTKSENRKKHLFDNDDICRTYQVIILACFACMKFKVFWTGNSRQSLSYNQRFYTDHGGQDSCGSRNLISVTNNSRASKTVLTLSKYFIVILYVYALIQFSKFLDK